MCRLVLLAADYYELPYKAGVFLTGSPDYNSTKQIIEAPWCSSSGLLLWVDDADHQGSVLSG
jgi:hypothetical protein